MEQEATILRSKTHELETEHEKTVAENRRLALRLTRRPPPTDSEKLLLDKMELEERIKALEKKLTDASALSRSSSTTSLSGSESPRLGRQSGRLSPNAAASPENSVLRREKDILEKDLKHKEDQINSLTLKVQHLEKEIDNSHQRLDARLKAVQRQAKKPTDTTTRLQMKVSRSHSWPNS